MRGAIVLPLLLALLLSACQTTPRTPATKQAYADLLYDQAEDNWSRLATLNRIYLNAGTVEASFEVPAAGEEVRNLTLSSKTGSANDISIARQAIAELRVPPIPQVILAQAHQNYLAFHWTFSVYSASSRGLAPQVFERVR